MGVLLSTNSASVNLNEVALTMVAEFLTALGCQGDLLLTASEISRDNVQGYGAALTACRDDVLVELIPDEDFDGGYRKRFVLPDNAHGKTTHLSELPSTQSWFLRFVDLCSSTDGGMTLRA